MIETVDLLIIGAGPAGLAAAQAAAASGARILLLDDNPRPGGQIWRDGPGVRLPRGARALRDAVLAQANLRLASATRVIAAAGPRRLLLEDEQRGWVVEYAQLILCTGARELLLPFPGWTLPGVTGAGGLQALLKGGLDLHGERLVIAGSGPLLLASAASAEKAGGRVLRIAEQVPAASLARFAAGLWRWPGKVAQALRLAHPAYRGGVRLLEAFGDERLQGVRLQHAGGIEEIACERLAAGFGLIPNIELGQLLGCRVENGALRVDAAQACSVEGIYAAGECCGFGGSEKARVEGAIAGYQAVGETRRAQALEASRTRWRAFAARLNHDFALDVTALRAQLRDDTLVCRCEDVSHAALRSQPDAREAKLATRCGMGACQGRICGAATQRLYGWSATATPRPPLVPARIGTLLQLD